MAGGKEVKGFGNDRPRGAKGAEENGHAIRMVTNDVPLAADRRGDQ